MTKVMSPTELRHGKPEAYYMEPQRIRRRRSVIRCHIGKYHNLVVKHAVNMCYIGSNPILPASCF